MKTGDQRGSILGDAVRDLKALEVFAGGPVAAAQLLGVNYTGSYCAWKSGRREIPPYILRSVAAHLKLYNEGVSDGK